MGLRTLGGRDRAARETEDERQKVGKGRSRRMEEQRGEGQVFMVVKQSDEARLRGHSPIGPAKLGGVQRQITYLELSE